MDIVEVLKSINWQTISAMFVLGWYYTKDIRADTKEMKSEMKEQGKRIDHLYQICVDLLKAEKR